MTLDQWLQEALGVFPKSVQRVLRQEYTAHYQDHLEAGGDPDAAALFGAPSASQKRLNKTYLTQDALDRPRSIAVFLAAFIVVFSGIWIWLALNQFDSSYAVLRIIVPLIGLLAGVGVWVVTRPMVEARQTSIRHLSFSFLICFEMLPNTYLSSASNALMAWSLPITMLLLLHQLFDTDRRVRRTLNPGASKRT